MTGWRMKLSRVTKTCVALFIVTASYNLKAQVDDLMPLTYEGTTKATSASEATREIQANAIAETARAKVQEIIGEKKFTKYKALVESKIIRQAVKFMPFVNSGSPVQQPDGTWKMNVELKMSTSSLRKMILDAGLLSEAEGPASILPMIAFVDRQKNSNLRWWMGDAKSDATKFLSQSAKQIQDAIQTEFSRQGFHMIKPLSTTTSPVPEAYRIEQPTQADQQFLSEYFQAPMILKGEVRFKEVSEPTALALCALKLQVVQAHSGRTIAEVSRQLQVESGNSYETAIKNKLATELPELSKDLATQVYDAWSRGTLNTSQVRIVLNGVLTPKQLAEFKTSLLHGVQEVKGVKERLFDVNQTQFEVDYTGEFGPLTERLKTLKVPSLDTRLSSTGDSSLTFDVKSR